jgi:hypothetical protein
MKHCFTFLLLVASCFGQAWSGIIDPSRAIDWTQAGFPGITPPDASWTQCGSTIAPYSGSGATITSATAGCSNNQYVLLGNGTFNLTSGFNISHDNVVVRGGGANQTFLVMTGHNACLYNYAAVCIQGSTTNASSNPDNVCDWIAGYTAGTTVITIANCGSTTPAVGSLSNLTVGSMLVLDQLDEGTDPGSVFNCNGPPASATSITYYSSCIGGTSTATAYQGGFQRTDGPCLNSGNPTTSTCTRGQEQIVTVTNIATSGGSCTFTAPCITISPGLYMPNWRSGQSPQVWYATSFATQRGIEDMSIDATSATGANILEVSNCYKCWVKGIKGVYPSRAHISNIIVSHNVDENNYFYQGQSHAAVSYATEFNSVADSVFVNNICQQVTDSCPNNNGSAGGNVIAYNYTIGSVFFATAFAAGDYSHAGGNYFNLHEGNSSLGYVSDAVHGTHHLETLFRNLFPGNQNSCGGSTCTVSTIAIALYASSRYENVIGNVMGDPGRNQIGVYQTNASACTSGAGTQSIYNSGFSSNNGFSCNTNYNTTWCSTNNSCGTLNSWDAVTPATLMRWGNWDAITAGCPTSGSPVCTTATVRWCGSSSDTGWGTTCGSTTEIPSSLWSCSICNGSVSFATAVPTLGDTGAGQSAMPSSFYFTGGSVGTGCGHSNLPFGKNPTTGYCAGWPITGPDVASGNLGRCNGGTYSYAQASSNSDCTPGGGSLVATFGGHANAIPAMECFLHVMGGVPDGTGGVLSFNETSCYANDPIPPPFGVPTSAAFMATILYPSAKIGDKWDHH